MMPPRTVVVGSVGELDVSPPPSETVRAWVRHAEMLNAGRIPDRPDAALVMDDDHKNAVLAWLAVVVELWMEAPHAEAAHTLNTADRVRVEWWDDHQVHVSFLPWDSGPLSWVYIPWADLHPEFAEAVTILDGLLRN